MDAVTLKTHSTDWSSHFLPLFAFSSFPFSCYEPFDAQRSVHRQKWCEVRGPAKLRAGHLLLRPDTQLAAPSAGGERAFIILYGRLVADLPCVRGGVTFACWYL